MSWAGPVSLATAFSSASMASRWWCRSVKWACLHGQAARCAGGLWLPVRPVWGNNFGSG